MSGLWLVPADGEPVRIEKNPAAVGRDPRADVVLSHPSVSRKHAVLEQTAHGWLVADQNSGNGTWVDGQRVIRALLRAGQSLRFGAVAFTVSLERPQIGAAAQPAEPRGLTPHPAFPPHGHRPHAPHQAHRPAAPAGGESPVHSRPQPPPAAHARPGSTTPSPAGVMSAMEAAEILGLAPGAAADEVRRSYQRIYNDLQIRLTNAPTATLKRMYQKNLQNLKQAAEVLAPGVLGS